MSDLFTTPAALAGKPNPAEPLASRMRPRSLDEIAGQQHILAPGKLLRRAIESDRFSSLIFYGPPGTGKTTLANVIARTTGSRFESLNGVESNVAEIRAKIDQARTWRDLRGETTLLFIDEIHRFSKSQQDSLLAAVEKGWITLIGATTENPSFEVIPALLSRCQIYVLEAFSKEDLLALLHRAIKTDTFLLSKNIKLLETEALIRLSGGDGRKLLNIFELVINASNDETIEITNEKVLHLVQKNTVLYDKTGEQHYDIVSAFIKSIRGSDPNGAVYWLARMLEGGEDVKFIARRMLILSSEDIGNANPTAFIMANNTFQAVATIGNPESRIILSQCAVYLATSPKSNSTYLAIAAAQKLVAATGDLSVPIHLRNAPTKLMKDLGYGENYKYDHDFQNNFAEQEFLPSTIQNTTLYEPGNNSRENGTKEFLKNRWKGKYGY